METLAMNNLWKYIQSLPLTVQDRQWLAGKLLDEKLPMPKSENKKQFQERLDMLGNLQENWDDEGALPIEKGVLDNVKNLIAALDDDLLDDWELFPAINSTLTFQHVSLDAILSIGVDDYSYVYSVNEVIVDSVENAPFSISSVANIFVKLKR